MLLKRNIKRIQNYIALTQKYLMIIITLLPIMSIIFVFNNSLFKTYMLIYICYTICVLSK